jgi:hypothetical protein
VNQYVKVALAVLSAIAVTMQAAFPGSPWAGTLATAITAALGALHLVPAAAAPGTDSPAPRADSSGPRPE